MVPAGFAVMTFIVTVILVGVELKVHRKRLAAVPGSRERYVWSSWYRVTAWGFIVVLALFTLGDLASGSIFGAICNAVLAAVKTWLLLKVISPDDDWFTGRGRKIKQAIRRAISRARTTTAAAAA